MLQLTDSSSPGLAGVNVARPVEMALTLAAGCAPGLHMVEPNVMGQPEMKKPVTSLSVRVSPLNYYCLITVYRS